MPRKTSGKKTTRKQKPPHFGSAVLADDVSHRPPEKTDCRGLITVIKAWAYPCTRTFIVVFTLFDLPRGKTRGKAWIRKKQSRNKRPLSDFWLSSRKIGTIGTVTIRVSAVLEEEGPHEVLLTLDKHRATLATPLVVRTNPWPKFTNKERAFVLDNDGFPHSIQAKGLCSKCGHTYVLEESLLSDHEPSRGTIPCPKSGILTCGGCEEKIDLRDLHGRLRQSIKERVNAAMAQD